MGLFSHNEYKTYMLSFRFKECDDMPVIQTYGYVDGKMRYYNAFYCIISRMGNKFNI